MKDKVSIWGSVLMLIGVVLAFAGVAGIIIGEALLVEIGLDAMFGGVVRIMLYQGLVILLLLGFVFIFMGNVLDSLKAIAYNTRRKVKYVEVKDIED